MEDQANTIFTIEAVSERGGYILKHSHNSPHYLPSKFPSNSDNSSRESTPDGSDNCDLHANSNSKLQFTFDQPPRSGLAFVFGSDAKSCDAYLGSRSAQISAQHFLVYFNHKRQLVLRDVSKSGSILVYDTKGGGYRRKDFVWILFKNMNIIFATAAGPTFKLKVVRNDDHHTEYLENLERFLTIGREIARTPESIALIGKHDLHLTELDDITTSSLPQGSLRNPLYHNIEELGAGSFGVVHKAANLSTGYVYAAKRFIRKQNLRRDMREAKLLKSVSHPHIVKYVDFTKQDTWMLIMEYLPLGSLKDCGKKQKISKVEAMQCFVQGLDALKYLQENKITHRDIKPANILVQRRADDGTSVSTKLADFGLAKDGSKLGSQLGTLPYASPEMDFEQPRKYPPYVADTWSLAVVFLEYYKEINMFQHYRKNHKLDKSHTQWCQRLCDKIAAMASHRPELSILKIVQSMLCMDETTRVNAGEVLKYFKQSPTLSKALSCIQSQSSSDEPPLCWENDPAPHENAAAQPKLYVDVEGVSEPEAVEDSEAESTVIIVTDAKGCSLDDSLATWDTTALKTVTALRGQPPHANDSQTTAILARTVFEEESLSESFYRKYRRPSAQATPRNDGRRSSLRSILAPVRDGENNAIDKSRLGDRLPSFTSQVKKVKPEFRSLELALKRRYAPPPRCSAPEMATGTEKMGWAN